MAQLVRNKPVHLPASHSLWKGDKAQQARNMPLRLPTYVMSPYSLEVPVECTHCMDEWLQMDCVSDALRLTHSKYPCWCLCPEWILSLSAVLMPLQGKTDPGCDPIPLASPQS